MKDVYQESLEMHRQNGGKLASSVKVPLEDKHDLSLAYTPGVAEICRVIAANQSEASNLTLKKNTVAVVSDGSAILGLGNLGAKAAIPVMEGKCALFKKFADVDAFPICLDTQDSDEIVETVKRLAPVFGGINLEDIAAPRCFEIEKRLKESLDIPVMHDDQHGTATVVLAGLINSLKLSGRQASDSRIVISGAGAAGNAVSRLLLEYGFRDIIVCDRQGAIYSKRAGLDEEKQALAAITNPQGLQGSLSDVLPGADIFIGVSSPGILSPDMVKSMAEKAIIFALANPVPEIMPEEALSAGAFIVASGRSDYPNQVNNVLAFPGIFRGALDNGVKQIEDYMLVKAAENIAAFVAEPDRDHILPTPFEAGLAAVVASAIKKN